jgi:hypothetical protein
MAFSVSDETHRQIGDDVRDRFHRGTPYSSKDFEGMSDAEHRSVLGHTGDLQRWHGNGPHGAEGAVFGEPHGISRMLGSGLYTWAAEHTGDMYWRTHHTQHWGQNELDAVQDKAEKVYRVLTQPYGFEREMRENLRTNSTYVHPGRTAPEAPHANWDTAVIVGKHYADEHSKLPVYHQPAELMGKATKYLGNMQFGATAAVLSEIVSRTNNEAQWDHDHSRQGNIDYLKSIGR